MTEYIYTNTKIYMDHVHTREDVIRCTGSRTWPNVSIRPEVLGAIDDVDETTDEMVGDVFL